jgi:Ni,Fe-hydrogenase I large subunit
MVVSNSKNKCRTQNYEFNLKKSNVVRTIQRIQETIQKLFERRSQEMNSLLYHTKKTKTLMNASYVVSVQRGNCCGYNDEVFSWAVHYYDEDDVKTSSL